MQNDYFWNKTPEQTKYEENVAGIYADNRCLSISQRGIV